MTDLSVFGVDRPAVPPRGPSKRPGPKGTRVEVHRLGPGSYEVSLSGISTKSGRIWKRRFRVPRARVRDLWNVVYGLALEAGVVASRVVLVARAEILAALIDRKGGAVGLLRPEEAAQGIYRAGFYDPEYHFPCLVLEYYHRRIERVGRRYLRIRPGDDFVI